MRFFLRSFVVAMLVAVTVTGLAAWALGAPFWITLVIIPVSLLLNGFMAEVEDRGSLVPLGRAAKMPRA